ncbi:MAG: DNA polymerase III subunit epsilon [Proteobacteria bacterium]|nr:DNA polymerase III subunit epsilon [Pseudomonadota bacterium]
MREVVLDTETTGLSHKDGHRIIEIGCVELLHRVPTGKTYHTYINPERDVSAGASAVSGLTYDFLKDFSPFASIASEFYQFIQESTLVIHNANFDIGFINAEFSRLEMPLLRVSDAIDTVIISRKKFPGQPANLDALCKRFNIDLAKRTKHGALVDAQLLADVYIELMGGRQAHLFKQDESEENPLVVHKQFREPRTFAVNQNEFQEHEEFLKLLKDPLWKKI